MPFRFLDQRPVYLNASGQPLAGGTLTFYNTGTTTPKSVWTDKANTVAATNPHTLNSQGRPTTDLWGSGSYRVVLKDSGGTTIWTLDDVDELLTGSGLPSQASQSGKFLTTNGSVTSWASISQLPSQTGNANKYLRTDGTTATWESVNNVPVVFNVASASTLTPAAGIDQFNVTALASPLTIADPTGTWADGSGAVIRIKDNGTARALSFGSAYRAVGVTLPTTTVISQTMYLGFVYNSADAKYDVVIRRP